MGVLIIQWLRRIHRGRAEECLHRRRCS